MFDSLQISVNEDGNLYVYFDILPSPPALALFTVIPGKWYLGSSIDYYFSLGSSKS